MSFVNVSAQFDARRFKGSICDSSHSTWPNMWKSWICSKHQGNRKLNWLAKLNPELSSDSAGMRSLAVLYGSAQSFAKITQLFSVTDRVQGLYTLSMIYIKLKTLSKALFAFFKFSVIRVSSLLERLVQVSGLSSSMVDKVRSYSYFFQISGLCELCNLPYLHWLVSVALPSVRGTWWDWTLGSHRPDAMLHTDWIMNHH